MQRAPHAEAPDDHDRGLAYDLATISDRRGVLKFMAGAALLTVVGCGSSGDESTTATTASLPASDPQTSTGATGSNSSCSAIPRETAGPFPGDGSNGPNVLTQSGIVRRDIRPSFGPASGVAQGVPLTVNLTVLEIAKGCAALAGAAVYVWQCDREGLYSLYSRGATGENYLRGVQETDSFGRATFMSIFPAAYSGRWPHIHFEVYPNLAQATRAGSKLATSQIALPKETCDLVFATEGYSQSVRNLSQTSLERDNVFRDGYSAQLATVAGSTGAGFTAGLTVAV